MKINRYNQFIIESILYSSSEFNETLKKLSGDPIADQFISLINKDIKTKFNFLNLTDKNDTLSFVSDNQATTKLKSGSSIESLFGITSNKTTVGRIFRAILKDNNINFKDIELEQFVNKFKAEYDKNSMEKSEIEFIKIVTGNDIKYWYDIDRYAEETIRGKGSLGNSCMRYKRCQTYFDIYTKSKKVSMVIQVDENDKLLSRSLLWNIDEEGFKYLDRIYYTNDSDIKLVTDWVENKFKDQFEIYTHQKHSNYTMSVTLDMVEIPEEFPYMDTFTYLDYNTMTLYNDYTSDAYELDNTEGGRSGGIETVYSEYHHDDIPQDDAVYSEYYDSYIYDHEAVYSNYHNTYIVSHNAVYSDGLSTYISGDISREVYIDIDGDTDNYPYGHDDIAENCETGDFYLTELMCQGEDGLWYLDSVELFQTDDEELLKKLYNKNGETNYTHDYCTKEDALLFDIKIDEGDEIKVPLREYLLFNYHNTIVSEFETKIKSKKGEKFENAITIKLNQIDKLKSYFQLNTFRYSSEAYVGMNNFIYDKWNNTDKMMTDIISKFTDDDYDRAKASTYSYSDNDNQEIRSLVIKLYSEIMKDPKSIVEIMDYAYNNNNQIYRKYSNFIREKSDDNDKVVNYTNKLIECVSSVVKNHVIPEIRDYDLISVGFYLRNSKYFRESIVETLFTK